MQEIPTKIRSFLSRYVRNLELQEDQDIFALGFMNSLFAMQLVLFVEKEFGISIGNDELELENFRTINAMTALIERKQAEIR